MKNQSLLSAIRAFETPRITSLFIGASAFLLTASMASAATIVGSFDTLAGYSVSDLELTDGTASDHWAIYGQMGYDGGSFDDFTSKTDSSPFGAISGAVAVGQLGGRIKFAHGAGFGDYPTATSSTDALGAGDQGNSGPISTSFDYTMQGTGEDLSIYLFTWNADQPSVDLSATMSSSGGNYTNTGVAMPTNANGDGIGLLQLSVTGATIGETLTFTISADYSETVDSTQYWGVGIAGATSTVNAIPEPGAFAALAGILGLAVVTLRRRRS